MDSSEVRNGDLEYCYKYKDETRPCPEFTLIDEHQSARPIQTVVARIVAVFCAPLRFLLFFNALRTSSQAYALSSFGQENEWYH